MMVEKMLKCLMIFTVVVYSFILINLFDYHVEYETIEWEDTKEEVFINYFDTNYSADFRGDAFCEHEISYIQHDYGKWGGMQNVSCYRCKGLGGDWYCTV